MRTSHKQITYLGFQKKTKTKQSKPANKQTQQTNKQLTFPNIKHSSNTQKCVLGYF